MTSGNARRALLTGSVGLNAAEDVFRTVGAILGDRLRRIPDGETGDRALWVMWLRRLVEQNAAFEDDPAESAAGARIIADQEAVRHADATGGGPLPRRRVRRGVAPEEIVFGNVGYADDALASYLVFARLQDNGVIPPDVRFQMSLPTTAAFLNAHVALRDHAVVEQPYRDALLREVDRAAAVIQHQDLAIQWDVSTEMAQWEGVRHAWFDDTENGVLDRLAVHCNHVPRDIELGIHLCYGDYGHKHWREPEDTANMVAVFNALSKRVHRPIHWLHMPVPRDRDDDAYFAPLRDLELPPWTEFYLGLIHFTDGLDGAQRRMTTASRFIEDFGVATECGFGRRPPDTIPDLLKLHAAASTLG